MPGPSAAGCQRPAYRYEGRWTGRGLSTAPRVQKRSRGGRPRSPGRGRGGNEFKQEPASPQDGREEDLLESLYRNRTVLHLRLKDRALEGGIEKVGQFIAVGGGR